MFKFYPLVLLLAICQLVNAQSVSISFSGTSLCRGKVEKVSFSTTGSFNADNYFKVQLSDASGNFTSPVELTRFYNSSLQKIAFVIPAATAVGTNYRLRVVSTSPVVTGTPTATLSIASTCTTPTPLPVITLQDLSSALICSNTTANVSWTVTGGALDTNHFFTVQLSDANGSFIWPYNLAVAEANTTSASFTIPRGFIEGTKYRIRVIASTPSLISNTNTSDISIRTKPVPSITLIPEKPCFGDPVRLIAKDGGLGGSSYAWAGPATASKDTLLIASGGPAHDGTYTVTVTKNGCSATATQSLMLTNCKPSWSWALADTAWSSTFNFPSTIVDTEIDEDNNLFVAGFFSQKMTLGGSVINTMNGNNVFCNDFSPTADKRTGFVAKISANGNLAWYRKWNAQGDRSDYQYCDLAISNGQVFIVSEFRAAANCPTNPRNEASLVIADEEDFSLGTIIGYCRFYKIGTFPAEYDYRYKGRFIWMAKFDINGNLDVLSNLTELKTCGLTTDNFDVRASFGLGTKGYYSLKTRNNKLWLAYSWSQGLSNTLRYNNGNEIYDAAGLVLLELNPNNLSIINYQKMNVYSPSGAMGMTNIEIDAYNNIVVAGSTATVGLGTAEAISFGPHPLIFGDSDYFTAKYNTGSNNWDWARNSQFILLDQNANAAPSLKLDSQNNIYLGVSFRASYGGTFANLTIPPAPQDYDGNNTAALIKLNTNGDGQWFKINNHTIRSGRNTMGIDKEDNIYFTSYLNNSASVASFLINEHRLPQKDLATFSNTSGNPFVAIYKPSGDLLGSINNIRVYDALYVNGLVLDNNKGVILSGVNFGKASFGQFSVNTNFGNASNPNDNRQRGFITKIANPQSIVLDNTNTFLCTGIQNNINFNTAGSFTNTSFKVELVDVETNKVLTVATGNSSPISFMVTDSLAGKRYYARVVTTDNTIVGTVRTDKILDINTTLLPIISSNLKGTVSPQGICHTDLPNYRIQTNITGANITLRRNGQVVYVGPNQDYSPSEQQTGVYKVFVEHQGCTGESAELDFRVSRPASAKLIGSQVLDNFNSPAYLSVVLEGGGEYDVNISGISSTLKLNETFETIEVHPTQNTTYTLASVSNYCGVGTISGSASVTLCQNAISLINPRDNYTTGTILHETNSSHGEITANNRISNNARVTYSAGRSVMLNPGFYASNTGVFTAEIKGCKSDLVARRDRDFKLGYHTIHLNRYTADRTIAEMTEFANKGARMYEVTIRLDEVFKTLSQFNHADAAELDKCWFLYDKILKHANNVYDYVALRINVDYDDTRYYFQDRDEFDPTQVPYDNFDNALFNLFGEIVQDQFNNPARVAYGSGHGSFSSLSATAKMKGFVQKIVDRYYPMLGEKLYWVSVATAAQFETGFNYENSWTGDQFVSPHPCEYDYSPDNVNAFRNWLITERYTSLSDVNAAYGTNYSEYSHIEPPKVPVDNLIYMNTWNVNAMYNSVLFEDWYHFNYQQMKKFLVDCKNVVKAKNNNIKFCFEAGSVSDQLSAARKTFDIPDISTYADILKANTATMTFNGLHTWEGDMLRSNFSGEIETEINEMDIVNLAGITDPATVKQKMIEYSKTSYLNNTKAIIFVSSNSTPYYTNSLDALAEVKNWIDTRTEEFSEGETIYVNLSDLIRNFPQAIAPFNILSSSLPTNGYENRPKIIITQNTPLGK